MIATQKWQIFRNTTHADIVTYHQRCAHRPFIWMEQYGTIFGWSPFSCPNPTPQSWLTCISPTYPHAPLTGQDKGLSMSVIHQEVTGATACLCQFDAPLPRCAGLMRSWSHPLYINTFPPMKMVQWPHLGEGWQKEGWLTDQILASAIISKYAQYMQLQAELQCIVPTQQVHCTTACILLLTSALSLQSSRSASLSLRTTFQLVESQLSCHGLGLSCSPSGIAVSLHCLAGPPVGVPGVSCFLLASLNRQTWHPSSQQLLCTCSYYGIATWANSLGYRQRSHTCMYHECVACVNMISSHIALSGALPAKATQIRS